MFLPDGSHIYNFVNLNTQSAVEGISSSLSLGTSGGLSAGLARLNRRLIGLARILQSLASEIGNDLDVKRRAVVEVGIVETLEASLLAPVKTLSELDSRAAARAKVETTLATSLGRGACLDRAADLLGVGSSEAGRFLSVALSSAAGKGTGIGSVGTGVLLDCARALDSSSLVQECGAVDCKGTVASTALNSRGRAAEVSSETLDVDGSGGSLSGSIVGIVIGIRVVTHVYVVVDVTSSSTG